MLLFKTSFIILSVGKNQHLKIKITAILCGLIPSFQNIENHTMRDINQFIEAALEQRVYGTTADVEDID